MRTKFLVGTIAFALSLGLAGAGEQQKPEHPTPADPQKQAMMEAWMKASTPGENHKLLEPMVGTFDAKVMMWEPGAAPSESAGVSVNTWILGGRFVQQKFNGTYMGMPFEGVGFTGYDNVKKKFIGSWMDSMGTMMMVSVGTGDATGKVLTFECEMDDPMTGKPCKIREVARVVDANKHVFEMFGPDPAGKEYKMMEITYTRKP